jgi:hypothetical protein
MSCRSPGYFSSCSSAHHRFSIFSADIDDKSNGEFSHSPGEVSFPWESPSSGIAKVKTMAHGSAGFYYTMPVPSVFPETVNWVFHHQVKISLYPKRTWRIYWPLLAPGTTIIIAMRQLNSASKRCFSSIP